MKLAVLVDKLVGYGSLGLIRQFLVLKRGYKFSVEACGHRSEVLLLLWIPGALPTCD